VIEREEISSCNYCVGVDLLVPAVCQRIQNCINHAYQVISLIVASRGVQVVQVKRKVVELQVHEVTSCGSLVGAQIATRAEMRVRDTNAMGRMEYTFNDPIYAIY
jgi:hypothetical protein